ncbi:MAG: DUF4139 domain-containing protein [Pseudomonadota bacterium]
MRLALLLAVFPGFAWAEDVMLPAPVSNAVIYPGSLTLTRRDTAELAAGAHRLLIPLGSQGALPSISLDGAALRATSQADGRLVDGTQIYDPAQAAAADALETAQTALAEAEDRADRAQATAEAAAAQISFWRSVSGGALTGLQPDAMAATAAAIADGVTRAQIAQVDARAALRAAEDALEDANLNVRQASRDLEATAARPGPVDLLVLDVEATGGPVTVTLEGDAPGGWTPLYDAFLDEGAGNLTLVRRVEMRQGSGLSFRDAAILLSTADPNGQSDPSPVAPNPAVIREKETVTLEDNRADSLEFRLELGAPVQAEALLPEDGIARYTGAVVSDLPVLTYGFPTPVDLPPDGQSATVTLGTLDLPVRIFNRAAPRRDAFAFLMAEAANGPPETLLPGPVTRYRGETRVGEAFLPLTPAGDALEMAFGPRRDLPIEFVLLDNETGEDGFFTTSGTRVQDMAIRARNLSDAPETIETRFALPYSEQEDLEITVRATPLPDRRDVDDDRGVSQWNLNLAPGAEAEIDIRVQAEWPEGQVLLWQP